MENYQGDYGNSANNIMLIRGQNLIHMLNQFRVCHGMGYYGAGKTLSSMTFAYELYLTGRYRYILGNLNSVWTDNPQNVVLRDGSFVDAIVILDEAGVFLKLSRDADKFLLGLRKLNITILCPSVLPVSSKLRALTVQRTLNGQAFGFPIWLYEYRLNCGTVKEKGNFAIYQPQKYFGIYDTLDYPVDDLYLSEWLEYWMEKAKESRPKWAEWGHPPNYKEGKGNSGTQREDTELDRVRWELEENTEQSQELIEALSLSAFQRPKKGRK